MTKTRAAEGVGRVDRGVNVLVGVGGLGPSYPQERSECVAGGVSFKTIVYEVSPAGPADPCVEDFGLPSGGFIV